MKDWLVIKNLVSSVHVLSLSYTVFAGYFFLCAYRNVRQMERAFLSSLSFSFFVLEEQRRPVTRCESDPSVSIWPMAADQLSCFVPTMKGGWKQTLNYAVWVWHNDSKITYKINNWCFILKLVVSVLSLIFYLIVCPAILL